VSHPYKATGEHKIIVLYKLVSYLHGIWKIKYSVLLGFIHSGPSQ
jgi:hypothetical protein